MLSTRWDDAFEYAPVGFDRCDAHRIDYGVHLIALPHRVERRESEIHFGRQRVMIDSWEDAEFVGAAIIIRHFHFQQGKDHWAIVDLFGKAGHVRTVPVPDWVRSTLE
jgi:hypothetical protein